MKKKVTDTEAQVTLPEQEKFFSTAKLKSSARAGTQLPDPTHAPYGFDAATQYRHLFPALQLPALHPPANYHPEDSVSFESFGLPPHELYLGDNLYVLRQLQSKSIDLIYIDPPFFSNRTYTQIWGDDNEVRSFGDIFQDGMYSYLAWLNARLWEMKRVLKDTGSIYVHCDWHASHYIKTEMDKIFGYDNFRNELIWKRDAAGKGAKKTSKQWSREIDIILYYTKTDDHYFNQPFTTELKDYQLREYIYSDPNGRKFKKVTLGDYSDASIEKMRSENLIYKTKSGREYKKYYLDEAKFALGSIWDDIVNLSKGQKEQIGYPTQKPEALLKRIISASSKEGDTIGDFFMGGGTTGAVALKTGRRFIGCDISRVAVSVSASRLVEVGEEVSGITVKEKDQKSMDLKVQSVADIRIGYVGSYPIEKFAGMSQQEFSDFVLGLYEAVAFTGQSKWIHGLANGKLVISVGSPDPTQRVGMEQVKGVVEESLRQYEKQLAAGEEKIIQIIGWSFDPAVEIWKGQAITMLNKKGLKLQIDLVSLSSEAFRQKIFRHIGESNLDLKFNRLNQLLSFTGKPYAGTIRTEQKGLTVKFTLEGARPVGTGRLINCQWDFSYDGQRFASKQYALNREKQGEGDFEAILTIEHTFPAAGTYNIAARVQDNLDGEASIAATLKLDKNSSALSPLKP